MTVGAKNCRTPCELVLKVGKYVRREDLQGYKSVADSITVAAETKHFEIAY